VGADSQKRGKGSATTGNKAERESEGVRTAGTSDGARISGEKGVNRCKGGRLISAEVRFRPTRSLSLGRRKKKKGAVERLGNISGSLSRGTAGRGLNWGGGEAGPEGRNREGEKGKESRRHLFLPGSSKGRRVVEAILWLQGAKTLRKKATYRSLNTKRGGRGRHRNRVWLRVNFALLGIRSVRLTQRERKRGGKNRRGRKT